MIKGTLFVRDGSGYYGANPSPSAAEIAYGAACDAAAAAGRAETTAWYDQQVAPLRAELGLTQPVVEAPVAAVLGVGATALKVS